MIHELFEAILDQISAPFSKLDDKLGLVGDEVTELPATFLLSGFAVLTLAAGGLIAHKYGASFEAEKSPVIQSDEPNASASVINQVIQKAEISI